MIDVVRPAKAPPSLSEKKSYKDRDVLEALHLAFLGKCYLCETRIMVGTFEVDHRKPKAPEQFPELEFAWTNLFPTCNTHRCNQRRERRNGKGSGEPAQNTAFALRSAIHAQILDVAKIVRSLELLPSEATEQRAGLREELRKLLSRRAPYTMLVRSYFWHRPELRELFD